MNAALCERLLNHFGSRINVAGLDAAPWFLIAGKTGPNAVLKLIVPPQRRGGGYVLSVARHPGKPVVKHEVDMIARLRCVLPDGMRDTIPEILAAGAFEGMEYLAMPFYPSYGQQRLCRRLLRKRRYEFVLAWLNGIALHTRSIPLSSTWIQAEYAGILEKMEADPGVGVDVKRRLTASFDRACRNASQIPSVCCHGDLWQGNLLWSRWSTRAVVLDWGAARWPGLPCVDLCRFALSNIRSDAVLTEWIASYCRTAELNPDLVPALYDLYKLFVKAELDTAGAIRVNPDRDPFLARNDRPAWRLAGVCATIKL